MRGRGSNPVRPGNEGPSYAKASEDVQRMGTVRALKGQSFYYQLVTI